ncbi:MAG: hypothetical protein IT455_03315 [Planctomycetes bacterium]|nr:hypothetical protein [Planctomycetota bacterium]
MTTAWWAALATMAIVAVGDLVNRHLVGWLPDDPPRPGRKQHARPMPLGGGLMLPVALLGLGWQGAWFTAAAAMLAAAIGWIDDRGKERGRDLDWKWKALGLGAAALLAAAAVASPWREPWLFVAIAAFVFVLTNATNFLDNTDGVCTALSATSLLLLGNGSAWVMLAGFATLGFLPWNWPRPRLFLGDAGAYLLGVLVATAAAEAARHDGGALLAVAVQLGDFVQVVAARLWLGVAPWIGDRRHLTHIVQNLRLPRVLVAPLFVALAVLLWQLRQCGR